MSCPPRILLNMKPIIIGVSTTPEPVALSPRTACTKSGRNSVAPNMPTLSRKVAMTETLKMLFLNRAGSMIGSAARFSIQKNSPVMSAANSSSPTIWTESQAYWVPAHEKASSIGTVAATRARAPK